MTTANKITVIRILMIPVFVTLAIYYGQSIQEGSPQDWQRFAAIAVFLLAAASDGLDGFVARRYNQRSSLGMILDPIADKGLLLSGIITLSISNWSTGDQHYGKFPAWFPVLVITRDAVILVGSAVLHILNGTVRVRPSWTGKVATVLQMAAIAWVMLQLRLLPLLYVVVAAGFFTLVSGIIYVRDGVRQLTAQGHANAKVGLRRQRDRNPCNGKTRRKRGQSRHCRPPECGQIGALQPARRPKHRDRARSTRDHSRSAGRALPARAAAVYRLGYGRNRRRGRNGVDRPSPERSGCRHARKRRDPVCGGRPRPD